MRVLLKLNNENAKLNVQVESDKGNWIIPIATAGLVGTIPFFWTFIYWAGYSSRDRKFILRK